MNYTKVSYQISAKFPDDCLRANHFKTTVMLSEAVPYVGTLRRKFVVCSECLVACRCGRAKKGKGERAYVA